MQQAPPGRQPRFRQKTRRSGSSERQGSCRRLRQAFGEQWARPTRRSAFGHAGFRARDPECVRSLPLASRWLTRRRDAGSVPTAGRTNSAGAPAASTGVGGGSRPARSRSGTAHDHPGLRNEPHRPVPGGCGTGRGRTSGRGVACRADGLTRPGRVPRAGLRAHAWRVPERPCFRVCRADDPRVAGSRSRR